MTAKSLWIALFVWIVSIGTAILLKYFLEISGARALLVSVGLILLIRYTEWRKK